MVVGTATPIVGTVTKDDGDVTLTCWAEDTAVMAWTVSEDDGAMFCLNSPGNRDTATMVGTVSLMGATVAEDDDFAISTWSVRRHCSD